MSIVQVSVVAQHKLTNVVFVKVLVQYMNVVAIHIVSAGMVLKSAM